MLKSLQTRKLIYFVVGTFVLAAIVFGLYQHLEKDVTLIIDEQSREIKTYAATVEDLLRNEGITLEKEDNLSKPMEEKLTDHMEIAIKRAVPVTVYYGDLEISVKSSYDTVEDVLKDLYLSVDENDEIVPDIHASLIPEMRIYVTRIDEMIRTETKEIPYEVETRDNSSLLKGETKKVQTGEKGIQEITIKEIYENNKLVKEEVLEETIVKDPVNQIIEQGVQSYLVTSRGKQTYRQTLTMTSTAYDLSYESTGKRPGDKGYGLTATGTKARPGVVAVDPRVIPLGTKLYIKSLDGSKDYGYAVAEDTGGAVKGNKIDLFFDSRSAALRYGRRTVRVYILK